MDDASIEGYKEMIRVITFLLETSDTCLKLNLNLDDKNWDLVVYSDNYWAGEVENRISVTGFIIFLLRSQFVGGQRLRRG
jgi:hypothetical protein